MDWEFLLSMSSQRTNVTIITQAQQRGVSLVEVLVTIVLSVVGLVGLSQMQLTSLRAHEDAHQQAQAIWLAHDLSNRIRANEVGRQHYVAESPLECKNRPSQLPSCAAYQSQNRWAAATTCTAQQMAEFDVWHTLCGYGRTAGTWNNNSDYLANPSLTVTPQADASYLIELQWDVRAQSAVFNQAIARSSYRLVVYP